MTPEPSGDLAGRVALVTGASSGIGRATALQLAQRGAHVLIHYARSDKKAADAADAVRATGREATTLQADLTDRDAALQLADEAEAWKGRVDVLVNNAGTMEAPLDKRTEGGDLLDHLDDWDDVVNTNLRAPYVLAARLGRAMTERDGGTIVNVASVAGMYALTDAPLYSLTKAGLLHLTRQLAQMYAPKVRVNAVAPGWIETGFGGGFIRDPEFQRQVSKYIPQRRVGEPDEVARAIAWLAADGSYVTGTTVTVDGGMVSELR